MPLLWDQTHFSSQRVDVWQMLTQQADRGEFCMPPEIDKIVLQDLSRASAQRCEMNVDTVDAEI
jgi:hypothetical protein